jgi:predicted amidophosphoribosyltransferase
VSEAGHTYTWHSPERGWPAFCSCGAKLTQEQQGMCPRCVGEMIEEERSDREYLEYEDRVARMPEDWFE